MRLSVTAFLIPKFSFGVVCRTGVRGVFLSGLGDGEIGAGLPNFSLVVAKRLAAGDIVANLSSADVCGLGDGLNNERRRVLVKFL